MRLGERTLLIPSPKNSVKEIGAEISLIIETPSNGIRLPFKIIYLSNQCIVICMVFSLFCVAQYNTPLVILPGQCTVYCCMVLLVYIAFCTFASHLEYL